MYNIGSYWFMIFCNVRSHNRSVFETKEIRAKSPSTEEPTIDFLLKTLRLEIITVIYRLPISFSRKLVDLGN